QPVTITTERWSMLYSSTGGPVELYDLVADPGQRSNVAADHPSAIETLHRSYVQLLEACETPEEYLAPRRRL
ncbi:MAG: hypothetical protein ACYDAG_17565, partial [Chloroflexota bacterium]